jgi:hypothetical protein
VELVPKRRCEAGFGINTGRVAAFFVTHATATTKEELFSQIANAASK